MKRIDIKALKSHILFYCLILMVLMFIYTVVLSLIFLSTAPVPSIANYGTIVYFSFHVFIPFFTMVFIWNVSGVRDLKEFVHKPYVSTIYILVLLLSSIIHVIYIIKITLDYRMCSGIPFCSSEKWLFWSSCAASIFLLVISLFVLWVVRIVSRKINLIKNSKEFTRVSVSVVSSSNMNDDQDTGRNNNGDDDDDGILEYQSDEYGDDDENGSSIGRNANSGYYEDHLISSAVMGRRNSVARTPKRPKQKIIGLPVQVIGEK